MMTSIYSRMRRVVRACIAKTPCFSKLKGFHAEYARVGGSAPVRPRACVHARVCVCTHAAARVHVFIWRADYTERRCRQDGRKKRSGRAPSSCRSFGVPNYKANNHGPSLPRRINAYVFL